MANPVKGEVPVTLADGRQLVLVLDMEALIEAEAAYGKPMRVMMQDAAQEFMGAMRAILYGSLRARHPSITPREAGALLANATDNALISEAIDRAASLAFPPPEDHAPGAEDRQGANPPGPISGNSGAKRASIQKRSGGKPRARSS